MDSAALGSKWQNCPWLWFDLNDSCLARRRMWDGRHLSNGAAGLAHLPGALRDRRRCLAAQKKARDSRRGQSDANLIALGTLKAIGLMVR